MKKLIILLAVMAVSFPLWGWTASRLWLWFVVPLGVHPVGMWQASGIMCLARFITQNTEVTKKEYASKWMEEWGSSCVAVLGPVFALSFGYVFHWLSR